LQETRQRAKEHGLRDRVELASFDEQPEDRFRSGGLGAPEDEEEDNDEEDEVWSQIKFPRKRSEAVLARSRADLAKLDRVKGIVAGEQRKFRQAWLREQRERVRAEGVLPEGAERITTHGEIEREERSPGSSDVPTDPASAACVSAHRISPAGRSRTEGSQALRRAADAGSGLARLLLR